MAITLDGTNGITTPDVDADGLTVDTNTLHVDSTNNRVGIGTSSPAFNLDVRGANGTIGNFVGDGSFYQGIGIENDFGSGTQGSAVFIDAKNENGIVTNNVMFVIDADGSSRTTFDMTRAGDRATDRRYAAAQIRPVGSVETQLSLYGDGGGGAAGGEILNVCRGGANGESFIQIFHNTSSVSGNWFMGFSYGASVIGSITQNGTTGVSYNTSSDYRLKEDVQPMLGASDRVLALSPVNFAWKADGTRVDGFIAHEAQAVVPEAVTGAKDEVDADGKPVYQGIDQSKLVPLLTAALQEALGEIESLKARIEVLEAKP